MTKQILMQLYILQHLKSYLVTLCSDVEFIENTYFQSTITSPHWSF